MVPERLNGCIMQVLTRLGFQDSSVAKTAQAQARVLIFNYWATYCILKANKPKFQKMEPVWETVQISHRSTDSIRHIPWWLLPASSFSVLFQHSTLWRALHVSVFRRDVLLKPDQHEELFVGLRL